MCIRNRIIALIYRVIAFCLGAITLVYDFGLFNGIFKISNLLYFTIISNLFCVGLFLALIIRTADDIKNDGICGSSSISPHFKGGVLMCILLTMSVYHFVLIPYALKLNPYQSLKMADVIFHYVMPFFTLFDWILFDEKGKFKWYDPIVWTVFPYFYAIFIFVQSKFDIVGRINSHMNRYIYAFLDVRLLGVRDVAINIFCLTDAFVLVGYFIYGVDRIQLESKELS